MHRTRAVTCGVDEFIAALKVRSKGWELVPVAAVYKS
jgi:hypothetical protein